MVWFFGDASPRQQETINALYPAKAATPEQEAVPKNRAAEAGLQAEAYAAKKSISYSPAKNGAASSNLGSSIVPYGARGGKREASATSWSDAPKRGGGGLSSGSVSGGKQQMASEASDGAAPAKHGRPPSKQTQQEEVLAPLDHEEREALERRLLRGGAGRFATARPGAMKYGLHGVHSSRQHAGIPAPTGTTPAGGTRPGGGSYNDVPSGTDGWGVGVSGRLGYERGNAGYSSRVPGGLANTGYLSPSRMRAQALTARAAQEQRERQAWEAAQKEKARVAAMRAAAYSARLTEQENERKQAARRALEQKEKLAKERAMLAAQSARKASDQGLGKLNIGKAIHFAQPSGRHGKPVRRKKQPRPEWGSGHAGGARMRKDARVFTPINAGGFGHDAHTPMVRV